MDQVLFREEQRLGGGWARVLQVFVVGLSIFVVGLFAWGVFEQLILGRPWGDRPLGNVELVVVAVLVIGVMGAVSWLMFCLVLKVWLDRGDLHILMWPFVNRSISLEEIRKVEVRTVHPLTDYGGYGARIGWRGWGFFVNGNKGVEVLLASGKRVFIGSQRAEELAAAIESSRAQAMSG